jgi:hypothetical protein
MNARLSIMSVVLCLASLSACSSTSSNGNRGDSGHGHPDASTTPDSTFADAGDDVRDSPSSEDAAGTEADSSTFDQAGDASIPDAAPACVDPGPNSEGVCASVLDNVSCAPDGGLPCCCGGYCNSAHTCAPHMK